jgi:cytochrome c biogenesis protein CcmG/thiol:disulfide interchange protein DsbE
VERPANALAPTVRVAIILVIAALVVVLMLAFRRDPLDIRTGTIGKPAAWFTAPKLDGSGQLSLRDYEGKVIVVNFFASWCIPCKEENPALVRVYERYRASDVVFLGVLYQDSNDRGLSYVKDNGVVWPTANDGDGRVAFSFGARGIPETYFIGADGIIHGRHIGPIDETTLVRAIDCMRAKSASPECVRAEKK